MVCGAVAEAVQRSEAHVAEALRLEETLRERIAALPPADFEDILHSAFILSLHVRPGASVLHVRATPTSLLRAVLVRTRGTGQLAPERHALYVHRTRITLGRAGRAPLRSAPPPLLLLHYSTACCGAPGLQGGRVEALRARWRHGARHRRRAGVRVDPVTPR